MSSWWEETEATLGDRLNTTSRWKINYGERGRSVVGSRRQQCRITAACSDTVSHGNALTVRVSGLVKLAQKIIEAVCAHNPLSV